MAELVTPPVPGVCSARPLQNHKNAALCQVAQNTGCPHVLKLNSLQLCLHPESHLFFNNPIERPLEKRRCRVMLVDHHVDLMQVTASVLSNAGYEVMDSSDEEFVVKVLEEWSHLPIDLVIADAKMTRVLRQTFADLRPLTKMLVISNSAHARQGIREDIPLLPKPFTSVELLKEVIKLIGKPAVGSTDSNRGARFHGLYA